MRRQLTTQANLDATGAALTAAGVGVAASNCGIDGNAHAAVCGADGGDVFLFTLAPGSETKAQGLGFRPGGEIPDARAIACR